MIPSKRTPFVTRRLSFSIASADSFANIHVALAEFGRTRLVIVNVCPRAHGSQGSSDATLQGGSTAIERGPHLHCDGFLNRCWTRTASALCVPGDQAVHSASPTEEVTHSLADADFHGHRPTVHIHQHPFHVSRMSP
jgi:hypothetical protein